MERLHALAFLTLMFAAAALATKLDPRGARPVEQGTRSEKCDAKKEWPFCTDDQWGPKCPSGCRILGLINKYDHDTLRKVEKIRSLLNQNQAKHRSADHASKTTYSYLRDKLTIDAGHDNNYYDLAQTLRQRITDMKIKIDRQLRILAALKDRVKDQVVDMQKLEVDIDIKLRSCKGSCQSYTAHEVDQESYVGLEKQINQLDSQTPQNIESVGTLYVMKSRPLQGVIVDSIFKSRDLGASVEAQQKTDMFDEVKQVALVLETEGSSSSSPATVSKDPGTSYSSSSSSSSSSSVSDSSSSSSTPSKSITELRGFDGFGTGISQPSTSHVSSVTCTKSIRTTVVHTKNGPVEKREEVMEGGPECQSMTDLSNGGLSSLFPGLTSTSSSSSSSSSLTKTVHSGGAKGSLLDTKSGFGNPFGDDHGLFMTDMADDDVPDFHARSLMSKRTERQADYVGKGTKTSDLE